MLPTYSLGGLKFAGTGATNFAGAYSFGRKWYVEVKAPQQVDHIL